MRRTLAPALRPAGAAARPRAGRDPRRRWRPTSPASFRRCRPLPGASAARRSSARSGPRWRRSRPARPAATANRPRASASRPPSAPWASPTAPIRSAVVLPCHRVIGAERLPDRLRRRPGAQALAARARGGARRRTPAHSRESGDPDEVTGGRWPETAVVPQSDAVDKRQRLGEAEEIGGTAADRRIRLARDKPGVQRRRSFFARSTGQHPCGKLHLSRARGGKLISLPPIWGLFLSGVRAGATREGRR